MLVRLEVIIMISMTSTYASSKISPSESAELSGSSLTSFHLLKKFFVWILNLRALIF
jgi:hypothetical protein